MSATEWIARAACATRLDLPWTRDESDVSAWQALSMQLVCGACPVLAECLAAVEGLDVTGGWWAGQDRDPHQETPDKEAVGLSWFPIRSRTGELLGSQGAMVLPSLGGAA